MSLSAVAFAGCANASSDDASSSDDALSKSNPNVPANKDRIAILKARLPQIAASGAKQFALATGTAPLGKVVSAECTGKPIVETDVPSVLLTGCNFVYQNGTGTTTLSGSSSATRSRTARSSASATRRAGRNRRIDFRGERDHRSVSAQRRHSTADGDARMRPPILLEGRDG